MTFNDYDPADCCWSLFCCTEYAVLRSVHRVQSVYRVEGLVNPTSCVFALKKNPPAEKMSRHSALLLYAMCPDDQLLTQSAFSRTRTRQLGPPVCPPAHPSVALHPWFGVFSLVTCFSWVSFFFICFFLSCIFSLPKLKHS